LVQILNKPEEKIQKRLARRGFDLEECQKVLNKKSGDVILFNKRSLRNTSLKDFVGIKSC
jgi:hypothetical protein